MLKKFRNFEDFLINVIEWDIDCYSGIFNCKDKGKRDWKRDIYIYKERIFLKILC